VQLYQYNPFQKNAKLKAKGSKRLRTNSPFEGVGGCKRCAKSIPHHPCSPSEWSEQALKGTTLLKNITSFDFQKAKRLCATLSTQSA